ncbi:type II toxin-antitoxin system RelE/ParE family toxin [Roseisolibacter agri]|uniref:Toxin, RelE family protein n=1 Tax=Roseisolibacter agri TaxID=2014610 RepID=A0AA37QE51_9BACT|nr:type II toxin-antitoxin system RelE/ParE family toxin [Roseisolibacter agri]GLC24615.1 toxin, RelE family protein [Roseisolibacter agri]
MTPRLFVRRAARADIAEAFQWYEARSMGLGHEFLRAVRMAFVAITRAPEQAPLVVEDIRKLPLRRFPYVVYFVVLPRGISVLAVIHGRRDPRRWQSRR